MKAINENMYVIVAVVVTLCFCSFVFYMNYKTESSLCYTFEMEYRTSSAFVNDCQPGWFECIGEVQGEPTRLCYNKENAKEYQESHEVERT